MQHLGNIFDFLHLYFGNVADYVKVDMVLLPYPFYIHRINPLF